MKKLISGIVMMLLVAANSYAQSQGKGQIGGAVLDENAKPLEYVTVMLLKASDSTLVKGAITDAAGKYEFENIVPGKYLVSVSMVGYQKLYSPAEISVARLQVKMPVLKMLPDAKTLSEVVVVGQKPFIEQQLDKTVLNVESSIVSSGSTAMEVLEKAPGVMIDQDDRISLKGKQGVIIMIDGKQTYLSAQEVSNMLRNMQSNNIESIEIITNPSSKYDAAGNAGIINIKLKKNKNMGANGSVNIGTGYGRFGKYTTGANVNYRNGKFNAFANISHGYNKRYNSMSLHRVFTYEEDTTNLDQFSYRPNENLNNSLKAGVDYFINDKNTIGFMANGYINLSDAEATNTSTFSRPGHAPDSMVILNSEQHFKWQNMTYNLNYRRTFDSTARELTLDADYSRFFSNTADDLRTTYYEGENVAKGAQQFMRSRIPSIVDIKAVKGDYIHPLGSKAKFETGFKSSYVVTDNDVKFDHLANGEWLKDSLRTNHFQYTENINAVYGNYSREFDKFSVQLGLRMEHTISQGRSITLDTTVNRGYLEFFPSVFLSQKINKDHKLNYSYSRRIDRPSYQDLNPFVMYLDPYTSFVGNPYLKPQFTNSFQLAHSFKGMINTTLGYSHTKDVFTQVGMQEDSTKRAIASMANLDVQKNYSLGISAPIPITKWWMVNNNINVFYNKFESEFLGRNLNLARVTFSYNTFMNFTLPNDFSAEISGFYRSPNVWGMIRMQSMYVLNLGVQKSFMDKRATLKVNVNDVFNIMRFRGGIDFANMNVGISNKWESRVIRATFTYRFGKSEVKPSRRRSTVSDTEQNRIKVGDGQN